MLGLENNQVLVIGLGSRGQAAREFELLSGVRATSVDKGDTQDLRHGVDSHPQATCKPPTSHLLGISEPPPSHPQATSKPPSSHPQATLKPPPSHLRATLRRPSGDPQAILNSNPSGSVCRCEPEAVSGTASGTNLSAEPKINEVRFINDSKATNAECLNETLSTARPGPVGDANLWLIACGKDKGLKFHGVGPLFSKRVKQALLVGEERKGIRAAWSIFTPCAVAGSLLEALLEAAKKATSGDVVLRSLACSSWDQFWNHQHRGEVFCRAVKSIGRGVHRGTPNINGKIVIIQQ